MRTEISCLEKQKKQISDTVKALVVGVECVAAIRDVSCPVFISFEFSQRFLSIKICLYLTNRQRVTRNP